MKKTAIFIFIYFLFLANINAQTKTVIQQKTDSVSALVIQYLRNHYADSLYRLTDADFKNSFAETDFKSVCETQFFPLNDFKKVTFVKAVKGINKYKINGATELQLLVGLDSDYKIRTLLIQPYKKD